ncbi:MAG TPA: TolC family protein [Bryobacteraceae bacterium]|nr:TolC family protein [Bryobacteraceae bacterium]
MKFTTAARILAFVCAASAPLPAQLTLAQAVEDALHNYPSVRVSQEQINAAAAGIKLARTAYLPRVDAVAQVNRATRNNVFGLLLPTQGVIPSMSGPVIGSNNLGTAWGSAVGGLVTWEPFDFGLRSANVATASAARAQTEAALKRTQFDVAVATADAYLTLAAAQETVRAAQAGVDRGDTVLRTIRALVNAEIRPGADGSRAEAELAAARTQLIQAEQATEVARATVSQFVGMEPARIAISAPGLQQLPREQNAPPPDTAAHPMALEQNAAVEQARAQLRALERSYFPRFYLQGAAYARGTGAETDGRILGGLNGLAPTVQDYALGFSVSFPVADLPAVHAREAVQSAEVRAQAARSQQIATDLRAQWNIAVATVQGARRIAANTPVQVSAARAAAQQATARYKSGLGNIDEVAEAQRLLTQAEIDDALARLGVWRGLLAVATAAGDIRPFVAEVGQ